MKKQSAYRIYFILSSLVALTILYIETNIVSGMMHFEEPVYIIEKYNIHLKGIKATLAHLLNFSIGLVSVMLAAYSYDKLRK